MNIGDLTPNYRVPAFKHDTLTTVSLRDYKNQWVILTCLFHFGDVEALFLDRQSKECLSLPATLLVLIQQERPFHQAWHRRVNNIQPPLLADPSRRLSRILGITYPLPPSRCEILLVDPQSQLRFRLIHDLNLRMFNATRQVLKTFQQPQVSSTSQDHLEPVLIGATEKISGRD